MASYQFDGYVPRPALADHSGRRFQGPPRRGASIATAADDDDESWIWRSHALHDWLAHVLGEGTLKLALLMFVDGLSVRAIARNMGWSDATAWRRIRWFRDWLGETICAALVSQPPADPWVRRLLTQVTRPDTAPPRS